MKKLISALLVLLLVLSLVPMTAAASGLTQTATVTLTLYFDDDFTMTRTIIVGDEPVTLEPYGYEKTESGTYYAFWKYSNGCKTITIPAYDGTAEWHKNWDKISGHFVYHTHEYKWAYNRTGHWRVCECGESTAKLDHDDPLYLDEKICHCGYIYSNNCDLTTLWLTDIRLTEKFNKATTDYTAEVVSYKDVTQTRITARTFDALATVELPESTAVAEGPNTYKITVTAEDKTTTKTYTVVTTKPVTVAGVKVLSNGTSVAAAPKATYAGRTATTAVPELLLEEMAELAVQDGCTQVKLTPDFNKWYSKQIDISLECSALRSIAEAGAELFIDTPFGTVTIPAEELTALAEDAETITVSIVKETDILLFADGTELKEISKSIDRDLY